jgi:hypothetical protein
MHALPQATPRTEPILQRRLADFLDAATVLERIVENAASALARSTLYPFVVSVRYQHTVTADGATYPRVVFDSRVIEAPLTEQPTGDELVPDGAKLLWKRVICGAQFDDMSRQQRSDHAPEYRQILMWRKAKAVGKARDAMVPWTDYDPVGMDETLERWLNPGVRYAGD